MNTPDITTPVSVSHSWRVVDIVVATVVGVACGVIFLAWNTVGYAWYEAMDALTPGLAGIATGIWLLGGPLGAAIIRRPGAAIFVETVAAVVSALIGNKWGITTLYSGLAQGLGAEIAFWLGRYRSYSMGRILLSGVLAGWGAWVLELFLSPNLPKGVVFNSIYLVTMSISGLILAGGVAWITVKSLRACGVLTRFSSGR